MLDRAGINAGPLVSLSLLDQQLVMELDAVEAEVITLARQLAPCMTIIDERRGRKIAQQVYGLQVKGSAGILRDCRRVPGCG